MKKRKASVPIDREMDTPAIRQLEDRFEMFCSAEVLLRTCNVSCMSVRFFFLHPRLSLATDHHIEDERSPNFHNSTRYQVNLAQIMPYA